MKGYIITMKDGQLNIHDFNSLIYLVYHFYLFTYFLQFTHLLSYTLIPIIPLFLKKKIIFFIVWY